ncbi:uncharacterized protein PSFLO_03197 [Pseudozyma flocculosa]|uniref:Uncharacterized protein n=1 Tax=Pseudozyma flocculosa TaxID=84751 RepID=A0A5C3F366_9BASI|nr:uncharacterized protein PSFLO_03197 [Pseudozyma flocculosa]
MVRSTICAVVALSIAATLAPVAAQLTTNNAQSACVEYGDCTTLGQNTFKTETQYAPVTPPAYTPGLATIINPASDSAYLSSLAAAGGSAAFQANQGGGAAAPTAANNAAQAQSTGGGGSVPASLSLGQASGGSSGGGANASSGSVASLDRLAGSLAVMVVGAVVGGVFVL